MLLLLLRTLGIYNPPVFTPEPTRTLVILEDERNSALTLDLRTIIFPADKRTLNIASEGLNVLTIGEDTRTMGISDSRSVVITSTGITQPIGP